MDPERIDASWDIIVVGGGITGAGVLREAVRAGRKTLLVEKNDFAWGTSSRSSKLVHGGLRYLRQGRLHLTWESVRHRQRLLAEAPGLVERLGFLMPVYAGRGPGRWAVKAGLGLYDLMAGKRYHRYLDAREFAEMAPRLQTRNLKGGFQFMDAQVDDARLVQRLINESVQRGAAALNYTEVTGIERDDRAGRSTVRVRDTETGVKTTFSAGVVINATGCWAETLHPPADPGLRLRPLRGSHLIFPAWRLPVYQAVTLVHPEDGRPLFIIPWEGALMLGTTDIDHGRDISGEIKMDPAEGRYLVECLRYYYPGADIGLKDAIVSYSGIRPVLSRGRAAPSAESREHVVWKKNGLVTVTGGKLTTFRALAADALRAASGFSGKRAGLDIRTPVFDPVPPLPRQRRGLGAGCWRRLYGRYGPAALEMVRQARGRDLEWIPGTRTLWAELPAAAKSEQVRHLWDLLLRRTRIGILLPEGGCPHLDRIEAMCAPVMDWDASRWEKERRAYRDYWHEVHAVPEP